MKPQIKKIWVDKGSEFYNSSIKAWLQDNNTDMNSADNEEKYQYMTSVAKNEYIDELDAIVNK